MRTHADGYDVFVSLVHKCKNLYNQALYTIRQEYDRNKQYLSESQLFHSIKTHHSYKELSSDNAQQTLRKVRNNYSSYLALLKLKRKGKYTKKVNIPNYLPKGGHFVSQFISRQIKRVDNRLRLSLGKRGQLSMGQRYIWVNIPPNIYTKVIEGVRIIPKFRASYMEIEFLYNSKKTKPELDYSQFLSIDLGLNNFATAVSTRETAFILEGSGIKSFNRWWNKKKAKLQSVYDQTQTKYKAWGTNMRNLNVKRYNVMRNYIANSVHYTITHCLVNKIGHIVVGDWGDMKRSLKMRKKTAQQFQQIPYATFKKLLAFKCDLYGIEIHFQDERNTSKTCFNCGLVRKANRIKRGLYQCIQCGIHVNADINGAINILKKVALKDEIENFSNIQWSSGEIISPCRVKLVNFAC